MKKLIIAIVLLLVAGVAALVLVKPTAEVEVVAPGHAVNLVPGSVTVAAKYDMELKSEVGGRILSSTLDPGNPVKQGEALAQIDPGDLQLEIEQTESEYEAAKDRIAVGSSIALQLESARENLANYERLAKAGSYPLAELEKQRRSVKQIEQSLALEKVNNQQLIERYENTLKVKHRQLDKMTIRAPFDGVVSVVDARPGDLIGGGTVIATLISTSRTVEAKISEENFANVEVGQRASVRFLGYGDYLYNAKVVKILPTADPETQRYIVHLEVDIDPVKLVPGITGEVSIVVGERDAKAIVPRRALFGSNLYVVKDGRVQFRTVELGYVSLTAAEVLKGVAPGDEVIVNEVDRFYDGQRVRAKVVSER
jgi:RND family efflux transporter MFP subunit